MATRKDQPMILLEIGQRLIQVGNGTGLDLFDSCSIFSGCQADDGWFLTDLRDKDRTTKERFLLKEIQFFP